MKKQIIFTLLVTLAVMTPSIAAFDVEFVGTNVELMQGTTTCANVDVHPRSCPNPFNPYKNGVLPVAILGTGSFDVRNIVTWSVNLNGVVALRTALEDVSQPIGDPANRISEDCTTAGPDGYIDLTAKFDAQEVAAALGPVQDGQIVPVTISAQLMDYTMIEGRDFLIIRLNLKKEADEFAEVATYEFNIQNFPNPFNSSTTIRYTLPEEMSTSLEIYNIIGNKVADLLHGQQSMGHHFINWNGKTVAGWDVPAGVYFAKITAGKYVKTIRLLLLR